jgi:hypothetical protein
MQKNWAGRPSASLKEIASSSRLLGSAESIHFEASLIAEILKQGEFSCVNKQEKLPICRPDPIQIQRPTLEDLDDALTALEERVDKAEECLEKVENRQTELESADGEKNTE